MTTTESLPGVSTEHCFFSISDDNYIAHFAAMLGSLAAHDRHHPFYLFHTDLSEANIRKIKDYSGNIGLQLHVVRNHKIDLAQYEKCGHWPQCVWLKFHVDKLLPASFTRAVFLDNDMIVTGPLDALFGIDMQGHPAAAVIDMQDANTAFKAALGIPAEGKYFNVGQMLVDVARWRETDFGSRVADFARDNPEKITFIDQCAFNAVGWREFLELDRTWNAMVGFVECGDTMPRVIHYCAMKPWKTRRTPGREFYEFYRDRSPYPMPRPKLDRAGARFSRWVDLAEQAIFSGGVINLWTKPNHKVRRDNRITLRRWFMERLAGRPSRSARRNAA